MVRKLEGSSGGNETLVTLSTKPIHRGGVQNPIVKTALTPNLSVKTAQKYLYSGL